MAVCVCVCVCVIETYSIEEIHSQTDTKYRGTDKSLARPD